jgi:hypothetical protein
LDEAEREMKTKKNSYYDFFICWNKATLLFYQGKYNEAIRNLTRLYVNDHFKKADVSLKIKIAVAECIMQYESRDEETSLKRVEQVRKQFSSQLSSDDFKRERFVLKLFPELIASDPMEKDKKLWKEVKRFVLSPVKDSVEDGEVLRYRVWLAPKVGIETEVLSG